MPERDREGGHDTSRRVSDVAIVRRLLQQSRRYWPHVAAIFGLSLLSAPLALLAPLPLKIAVDNALGSEPLPGLLVVLVPEWLTREPSAVLALAAGLLIAVALLSQLQELATLLLRTWTSERLVLEFRSRLFRHVQRLSLSYHDSRGTADSTYRIQYDAAAVPSILIEGLAPLVTATLTVLSMLYVTFRIDAQLALVALAVSPVLFGIARVYRLNLRRRSRQVRRLESSALGVVQEVLSALGVVKAFGQEEREQARFLDRSSQGLAARLRLRTAEGAMGLLLGLTTAAGTATVLFVGARHVQAGVLTLGDLLLVMGYLAQLYDPLKTMSRKIASLQSHLAGAERAFALLDEEPDVVERPGARGLSRAHGRIAVRNVCFAYAGGPEVLHGISFEVPPGTRVGVTGKTGAGKTTLVRLLMRFYDPTQGSIELDGLDLRNYRVADLRRQFSIVLQEPVLFSASVEENIAYARPEAAEEEIRRAARAAHADEFVGGLPQGYATLVGERGMRLSGGERQRIALARAFLKDAPILILDEPTSSVDLRTEGLIVDAMERLMEGRTSFMIAHRLSTLESSDLLLRIDDGRLTSVRSDVSEALREASRGVRRASGG